MKVVIGGGSGFIGRALTETLKARGHEVRWIRRNAGQDDFSWGPAGLAVAVAWADGVVNLAGEPVLGRWTASKKRKILESRLNSTRSLVEAFSRGEKRPSVFVCGSAIGIYGDRGGEEGEFHTAVDIGCSS